MPYNITASGSYDLAGHVVATGTAVTISASSATFDLDGFTISNTTNTSQTGIFAILNNGALHDITIKNGHIAGVLSKLGVIGGLK